MNGKRILIIDNNMVMVKLMTSFLNEQGHQTRTACDAFEALDMLKDYTPDIIFIDLIMPKISGDILCRMLRTIPHLSDCYIVIISATLAEQDLDLRKIGANGAIAKGPFTKMSTYILESIEESEDKSLQAAPQIKGSEDFPARHITKELIRRNQHLQKLLEGMSQGVIELEDDRVLFVNNAVETFLKTKKEILLGSYLSEQLDSETWNTLDPKISQHNSTFDEDEKESSVKLFGKHIIVHCLKFDENHRKQIILLTDITARKRMEAVVEASNLANNLSYIFSGIRHEIGNPLNSIKMALSVLQKNLDSYDKETIGEFVDRSLTEVMRLEYLLKALKNYSLFETPDVQTVRIDKFMDNFIPLIKSDLEKKHIEIRTIFERGKMVAQIDARALHHVLLNLFINAADAVEDIEEPNITISVKRESPKIIIKVDDNGCGISKEGQANLFKPFLTTKPQGTGLGLVIVQKMLSSMDSSISINSTPKLGTTVTISLPEAQ